MPSATDNRKEQTMKTIVTSSHVKITAVIAALLPLTALAGSIRING